MIAVLYMTNPLWQFIIAPLALVGIGWWLRGRVDRHDDDPLGTYYLNDETEMP